MYVISVHLWTSQHPWKGPSFVEAKLWHQWLRDQDERGSSFHHLSHTINLSRSVAAHYAILRRRDDSRMRKTNFEEGCRLFSKYCKEFSSLSHEERTQYRTIWRRDLENCKLRKQDKQEAQEQLLLYNKLAQPAYLHISDSVAQVCL